MKPAIIFDLGKVLVDFDYSIAARKIAGRGSKSLAEIKPLIEQSRFIIDYELGRLTRREFFEHIRDATGFSGSLEEFSHFFANIFTPIQPMIDLHAELRQRGFQTYVFSNTNDLAVEDIRRNFPFIKYFDGHIYSYEVGAMKPQREIYEAMEKMSGRRGADLIYIDDRAENIEAGRARGWNSILHETPEKTRAALQNFIPL